MSTIHCYSYRIGYDSHLSYDSQVDYNSGLNYDWHLNYDSHLHDDWHLDYDLFWKVCWWNGYPVRIVEFPFSFTLRLDLKSRNKVTGTRNQEPRNSCTKSKTCFRLPWGLQPYSYLHIPHSQVLPFVSLYIGFQNLHPITEDIEVNEANQRNEKNKAIEAIEVNESNEAIEAKDRQLKLLRRMRHMIHVFVTLNMMVIR